MTSSLFKEFFRSERAGGILLIFCAVASLLFANSSIGEAYQHIWHLPLAGKPVEYWINDGLMAIFFLLIGLELKREIYEGELSTFRKASLPVIVALGGMLVPAGIFLIFNFGLPTQPGAGIPMATDIAFAIGILSLLGSRIPTSVKVLLTALAVIDDLGAIIVIAIFYTESLALTNLLLSLGVLVLMLGLRKMKGQSLMLYLLGGFVAWYFMLRSGVHATIAGVLLAFVIPYGDGSETSPSNKLQHFLHVPVTFIILPLFALANTSLVIENNWMQGLANPGSIGIFAGLILGKPVGIFLFTLAAVMFGMSSLPRGVTWRLVLGVGFLGGIGFTMSIFITLLAYQHPEQIAESKIAVLLASVVSGTLGYLWLRMSVPREKQ